MSAVSSSVPLVAPPVPKNARSKRAAQAREPQLVEKMAKTAIFVRGNGISEKVKIALTELNQLKKPYSIAFSKSNVIKPFEDNASLSFWSTKNDASLFLVGTHTKKRPHGLVWARCFAGEVMEMLEVGIEEVMQMASFKTIKSAPGSVPLFHFSAVSPHEALWDSHPTYTQFKSILLDFFRGVEMDAVALKGLERVISVTIGGSAANDEVVSSAVNGNKGKAVESLISGSGPNATAIGGGNIAGGAVGGDYDEDKSLPVVHFRTYSIVMKRSGTPTPLIELVPHGPHFTFSLRRSQLPSSEIWKQAMKKQEKKKQSDAGKAKKNIDIDAMGDKVGRVYVDSQDMSTMQTRKFKGLKGNKREAYDGAEKPLSGGGGEGRKRPKKDAEVALAEEMPMDE